MQEFKLPDLGEGMHEAEIVQWLVKPGDTLKLDQIMLKVETDKAVVEIPSPVAGKVAEIRVQDGQIAKVGDVLVVFETPSSTSAPVNGGSSVRSKNDEATIAAAEPANVQSPSPTAQSPAPASKQRVLA